MAESVIHVPINIPLPDKLNLKGNIATNWKRFEREWGNYEIAARLKDPEKPDQNKQLRTATLLACIGSDALDVFDNLDFASDNDRADIDIVLVKLREYCIGKTNETYERYCFNVATQEAHESVDEFVMRLKKLSKTCNFGALEESLVRDRIVVGIKDEATQKKLLQQDSLTLKLCVDICRSFESTATKMKAMKQENVDVIDTPKHPKPPKGPRNEKGTAPLIQCKYCGRKHTRDKLNCPAWNAICAQCKRPNHFAAVCKSNQPNQGKRRPVKAIDEGQMYEEDEDEYVATIETREVAAVTDGADAAKKLYATMELNNQEERFQIDSGATVNVMSENTCKKLYGSDCKLDNTNVTLVMYNKAEEKPLGKKRVRVVNPKNNKGYSVEFMIVKGDCKSLLGARACQQMQLISVNRENIKVVEAPVMDKPQKSSSVDQVRGLTEAQIKSQFPEIFKGEGKLEGELHLTIDPSVQPVQLPTRKVPLAVRDNLKKELDRLTDIGVIAPVDVPTDWISATVVTQKKDGRVRLCIDPKPLNSALKRNHYPMPTIEDILPELSQARYFTVLDAKNGFWHVQLDEESSFATTTGTPWGRYRWLRMPFGISPAPEEFQRRLDIALEGLTGCKAVADDILVFGSGATDEEALRDHDRKLLNLLERCKEKGIKLNATKMQLRLKEVQYMGHLISSSGLKADPSKVKAIQDMPPPTDKQGVLRFLGMVNYVQRFAPKLSEVTLPLRDLIRKENEFLWDEAVHGKALKEAKKLLSEAPVLQYFDPESPTVLQCDASMKGLGACLMQNGHPIAYASRSLTATEENYAQIEKEMLAIVFGMEKFSTYVYGRSIMVESDHKPLESIFKKSLLSAPKRLQRMLLRLQRYNFHVTYKQGAQMYMADTLSRAYLPYQTEVSQEDGDVMVVDVRSATEKEAEVVNMLQYLTVTEETQQRIRQGTQEDKTLKALADVIKEGWPVQRDALQQELHDYFPFREELSVQDGAILKGERIVIPYSMRRELIETLHSSHLGIQGTLRRAREALYWPRMNKEIEEYISKCSICNTFCTKQQKEPLISHPLPSRPWEFVACDLLEFQGKDYLITTDYYSNFQEVDRLYDRKTAKEVIVKLKGQMARHGIPERLISDNGPQFASREFEEFAKKYQFEHITSSPRYPQSNGKAENAVGTVQRIMQKAYEAGTDPYLALLDFRNTPSEMLGSSPAQRLFGRRTRSRIPMTSKLLKPETVTNAETKLKESKAKQAYYYDKEAKELKPLHEGDTVRVQPNKGKSKWIQATVQRQVDVRSYEVATEDGRIFRRNRRHLRKTSEMMHPAGPPLLPADFMPEPTAAHSAPPPVQAEVSITPAPPVTSRKASEEASPGSLTSSNPEVPDNRRYTSRGREVKPPAYLKDFVP